MESNPYEAKYKQLQMLGKGNYGKVYKVRLNNGKEGKDASYFVAKKMFLEGMSEEDIQSAYGEIRILERLNEEIKKTKVPFLVGYEEFFRVDNELIIIMEYCEEGELSTYLKQLKREGQRLDQKIIGYWFTQLLFGIRVLHSKNILHRDLKSANIFLTKNFSLKIGDFGISKVLEHSSAITCIGTPLYLSPEVCNNQPYGFSSDLWALGCILYEMCSLRYPFEASNMIVLAKKIVMDKVEPIPSYYDPQLNQILMRMFEKDPKQRISIQEIFSTDYFRKVGQNFLKDQGRIRELAVPIALGAPPPQQEAPASETEDTWKTINSQGSCTARQEGTFRQEVGMTTRERLAARKIEEAKKREEELKAHQAAEFRTNQTLKQVARSRNMQGGLGLTGVEGEKLVQKTNRAMASQLKGRKQREQSDMEKFQDIPLDVIFNTIHNVKVQDADDEFEEVPANSSYVPVPASSSYVPVPAQHIEEYIEEDLEEYYDEEFEEYEETVAEPVGLKEQNEDIASYFQNELGVSGMSPGRKNNVQEALRPLSHSRVDEVVQEKEKECVALVGQKRFKQIVGLVREGRIDMRTLIKDKRYSVNDRKVIYKVEEMIELQSR